MECGGKRSATPLCEGGAVLDGLKRSGGESPFVWPLCAPEPDFPLGGQSGVAAVALPPHSKRVSDDRQWFGMSGASWSAAGSSATPLCKGGAALDGPKPFSFRGRNPDGSPAVWLTKSCASRECVMPKTHVYRCIEQRGMVGSSRCHQASPAACGIAAVGRWYSSFLNPRPWRCWGSALARS